MLHFAVSLRFVAGWAMKRRLHLIAVIVPELASNEVRVGTACAANNVGCGNGYLGSGDMQALRAATA
jgi:hypothetical protein